MRYEDAGVNLDAAEETTRRIKEALAPVRHPGVIAGVGAFAGAFDAGRLAELERPVLLASTDGVGTKTLVAARVGRWRGLGADLVNHGIDDLLAAGGRPLFFLDYLAAARLEPAVAFEVVAGLAEAAAAADLAVLGGETAEMPGVYREGALDLAGTIVGYAERARLPDPARVRPGDVLVALPSSGLHTNGYSLARRALAELDWEAPREDLGGRSVADALLEPHRSYLPEWRRLERAGLLPKTAAHITGGGVYGNLPRALPAGLGARLERGRWPEPPIFDLIRRRGGVEAREMFRVFNMGLGMLLVYDPDAAEAALEVLEEGRRAGVVVRGEGVSVEGVDG
ncbi:phosphoribosylformylglycinamidine cyclo-ligase [Oceanithermus profundus DSM 14977]|uniref:Phosphoribosylformylglycinamidine cyclo-ligase n=1 Tax=Oceanithermus profundus (strain DSM 14977 / NBRC 100410 / VKM B-2274 / 506) TaxID=670487 RepID=E4U463_OCEP5|nr:phosphoribosylformylglycinamidine cyclo-ligase [Oceanithermus profundus]ADR36148.1 phosphoribosylformylglycinamidine cyclo-ligase [Oceanithermus profundus DSM 14977]